MTINQGRALTRIGLDPHNANWTNYARSGRSPMILIRSRFTWPQVDAVYKSVEKKIRLDPYVIRAALRIHFISELTAKEKETPA